MTEETYKKCTRDCISLFNTAVAFAVKSRVSFKIPEFNKKSLRTVGYSDSSSANIADLSSQLEYIVFLGGALASVLPIRLRSYKSLIVTRSTTAEAGIFFSYLFGVPSTLARELDLFLGQKIPLQHLMDSRSLFDVISKGSRTLEKIMMLYTATARERFMSEVLYDISLARSSHNIADGLKKAMQQNFFLQTLRTDTLKLQPEQWITKF